MKQLILVLCLIFICDYIFSQPIDSLRDNADFQLSILDSAFRNKIPELKCDFFNEWYNVSSKLSEENQQASPEYDAVEFFLNDIYIPNTDTNKFYFEITYLDSVNNTIELKKIKWNGCFIEAEYFVVQTKIYYYVYNDSIFSKLEHYEKTHEKDSVINNFYPQINFLDKKRLYLTNEYSLILNHFILSPFPKSIEEMIIANEKRIFLQPQIELSKSHDGWFYHYHTFPVITSVFFNSSMDQAIVNFRSSFNTGGIAKYKKENGYWIRLEYIRESWIQ